MGRATWKNKLRGEKVPILEAQNSVYSEEALDPWVHVSKDEHLKGYVEQVQLVDYDIHNPTQPTPITLSILPTLPTKVTNRRILIHATTRLPERGETGMGGDYLLTTTTNSY